MPRYTIVSAEDRNRENPSTFLILPRAARESLRVGDFAKLLFDDAERMWVRVTDIFSVDGVRRYRGDLSNTPAVIDTISPGEEVSFGPEHICDADRREE